MLHLRLQGNTAQITAVVAVDVEVRQRCGGRLETRFLDISFRRVQKNTRVLLIRAQRVADILAKPFLRPATRFVEVLHATGRVLGQLRHAEDQAAECICLSNARGRVQRQGLVTQQILDQLLCRLRRSCRQLVADDVALPRPVSNGHGEPVLPTQGGELLVEAHRRVIACVVVARLVVATVVGAGGVLSLGKRLFQLLLVHALEALLIRNVVFVGAGERLRQRGRRVGQVDLRVLARCNEFVFVRQVADKLLPHVGEKQSVARGGTDANPEIEAARRRVFERHQLSVAAKLRTDAARQAAAVHGVLVAACKHQPQSFGNVISVQVCKRGQRRLHERDRLPQHEPGPFPRAFLLVSLAVCLAAVDDQVVGVLHKLLQGVHFLRVDGRSPHDEKRRLGKVQRLATHLDGDLRHIRSVLLQGRREVDAPHLLQLLQRLQHTRVLRHVHCRERSAKAERQ
eukprot:Rhum_TRINITY_DN2387_c0_g2::Rhum_TRINITY_DN2387_c0_g2_i1::g.7028::m.7028